MTNKVDALAALIREVDGNHSLGAGALAEVLVSRGVTIGGKVGPGTKVKIVSNWSVHNYELGTLVTLGRSSIGHEDFEDGSPESWLGVEGDKITGIQWWVTHADFEVVE